MDKSGSDNRTAAHTPAAHPPAAPAVAQNTTAPTAKDGAAQGGLLLLISGPAGSGKTTLCERMLGHYPQTRRVVTSTSRDPRAGEQHGIDYYFFAPDAFCQRIEAGAFYEWAQVHGRYYGTLKEEIDGKLARGFDLLINVDVQGAETFRSVAAEPDCPLHGRLVTVFVRPSNLDELRTRLHGRGTDDHAEIERRMETARKELEHAMRYDHVIESRDKASDFSALCAIYEAERSRRHHQG